MAALDAYKIRYLIVGGIAVGFYGSPRFTKDLDVLVAVGNLDHDRLYACLKEFGAPVGILTPAEFLNSNFIFYFGTPPWRIDILTSIPGVNFEEAFAERVTKHLGGLAVNVISRPWLIKAKRASGRPQDLLDLKLLEAHES